MDIEKVEAIDSHLEANAVPATSGVAAHIVAVRPILDLAVGLLFWKPSWQKALQAFIAALDVEFPR